MKINKEVFISFRVTKKEKEKVEKDSEQSGFNKVSGYVREKLGL